MFKLFMNYKAIRERDIGHSETMKFQMQQALVPNTVQHKRWVDVRKTNVYVERRNIRESM
jgi:hypothetical protein